MLEKILSILVKCYGLVVLPFTALTILRVLFSLYKIIIIHNSFKKAPNDYYLAKELKLYKKNMILDVTLTPYLIMLSTLIVVTISDTTSWQLLILFASLFMGKVFTSLEDWLVNKIMY